MTNLLPFDYAVRNLGRSPLRLAMSLGGTALVVMLVIAASAFVRGMEKSLASSGSARNVILLGAGSEESIERSELSASVPNQAAVSIPGIREEAGAAYVSPEVHMAMLLGTSPDAATDAQAVFRGVTPAAFLVHPQVQITEGRAFNAGENEVIIGALAGTRLGLSEDELAVGRSIWVDGHEWRIVGRFQAPNTVMDAEIWCPLTPLQVLTRRESLSCVVITLGEGEFEDAEAFALTRLDLELIAMRESDYYGKVIAFYRPVRLMVWVTAILIALGGLFGGLNTMYAAFAARTAEVGMLQSLGYSRLAVVISFVQESVLAGAGGNILGAGLAVGLLDGIAVRFSMGAFGLVVDGTTLAIGLTSGLALGVVGALPPTLKCLKLPITEALKSV